MALVVMEAVVREMFGWATRAPRRGQAVAAVQAPSVAQQDRQRAIIWPQVLEYPVRITAQI